MSCCHIKCNWRVDWVEAAGRSQELQIRTANVKTLSSFLDFYDHNLVIFYNILCGPLQLSISLWH